MERSEGAAHFSRVGRTSRTRGMAASILLGVAVFSAGTTVACSGPPSSRQFSSVLDLAGEFPLPVVLSDETGQVTAVESAPSADGAATELAVRADPTNSNAIIVSWLGGACDNDASLTFKRLEAGFLLNVAIHGKFVLGCTALGVPRKVRIVTLSPIPVDSVVVAGHT
jgi:hypothetical protein